MAKASLYDGIKERILTATRKDTKFYDIAKSAKFLKRLTTEVNPQLEEIEFYRGYRPPERDYLPLSPEPRGGRYRKIVELSATLSTFDRGQITFVGPAGSGKTTLLKAIARNVVDGKYPKLGQVGFVHFLQGRDLHRSEKVSAVDLLLHNVEPPLNEREVSEYIAFVRRSPDRVLFVIDSIDTLPYTLENENEIIRDTDQAFPGTILWNLLTGRIFPGCRVITSSREHVIRKYTNKLRAKKIIALVGLTKASIQKIIVGYLGPEDANEMVKYLEAKSPNLMSLCRTPVFLAFTLIGLKEKSDFSPTTMSGILVQVLRSLIHSSHAYEGNILEVIDKLKKFAFNGTKESRVLFSTEELGEYGLNEKEITDLIIQAPGCRFQKLLHLESLLFFCHQSLQEMLTAFFVAEMDLHAFEAFVTEYIHTPQYAVVRRILCGIILDEEIVVASGQFIQGEIKSLQQKRQFLKQSLKNQLTIGKKMDLPELLTSFNEAKDGMNEIIATSVRTISLGQVPVSLVDIHAAGCVLARCTRIDFLSLRGCNLDVDSLQTLASCIQGSNVKISQLNVSENWKMRVEGIAAIGQITRQSSVAALDISYCNLDSDQLTKLDETLMDSKISWLNISCNTNMKIHGMSALGRIVKGRQVETLNVGGCNLKSDQLAKFQESVEDAKLRFLDLREWKDADFEHIAPVAKLFANVTEDLILQGWNVRNEDRDYLQKNLNASRSRDLRVVLSDDDVLTCQARSSEGSSSSSDDIVVMNEESEHDDVTGVITDQRTVVKNPDGNPRVPTTDENGFTLKEIGPAGGDIPVSDCLVTFPANAVEKPTTFSARVYVARKNSLNPSIPADDLIDVTPVIEFKPRGRKFFKPITIKMSTWAKQNDTNEYSTPVIAKVFSGKSGNDGTIVWSCIDEVFVKRDEHIVFSCAHFCKFVVLIEAVERVVYCLDYFLCSDTHNNFAAVVCLSNKTLREELLNNYIQSGYGVRIPPSDRLSVRQNDHIILKLLCETQRYAFNPDFERRITINEEFFLGDKYRSFDCILEKEREEVPNTEAKVNLDVKSTSNRSRWINVPWQPQNNDATPTTAGMHIYHADNVITNSSDIRVLRGETDPREQIGPRVLLAVFLTGVLSAIFLYALTVMMGLV